MEQELHRALAEKSEVQQQFDSERGLSKHLGDQLARMRSNFETSQHNLEDCTKELRRVLTDKTNQSKEIVSLTTKLRQAEDHADEANGRIMEIRRFYYTLTKRKLNENNRLREDIVSAERARDDNAAALHQVTDAKANLCDHACALLEKEYQAKKKLTAMINDLRNQIRSAEEFGKAAQPLFRWGTSASERVRSAGYGKLLSQVGRGKIPECLDDRGVHRQICFGFTLEGGVCAHGRKCRFYHFDWAKHRPGEESKKSLSQFKRALDKGPFHGKLEFTAQGKALANGRS